MSNIPQPNFIALSFSSYEQPILLFDNPTLLNLFFFLIIIVPTLVTIKKSAHEQPFSISQTNQMKGLAILVIIIHHLCFFNIKSYTELEFWRNIGFVGVSAFLILSGFGLCVSLQQKGIHNFFFKRVVKIFIPLLFAISIEILLNHLLLQPSSNIFADFTKIFMRIDSIDRNSWFVVFILFWYCLTYLVFKLNLSNQQKLIFLCFVALIFLSVPEVIARWKVNAFSFPLGFWLGLNSKLVIEKAKLILKWHVVALCGIMLGCFLLSNAIDLLSQKFYGYYHGLVGLSLILGLAGIFYYFLNLKNKTVKIDNPKETVSLFFGLTFVCLNYLGWVFSESSGYDRNIATFICNNTSGILTATILILLVSLMVKFRVQSRFLDFLGNISFELYLLHGMFMYSFDFILFRGNIAVTFLIYLVAICLASLLLKRVSSMTSQFTALQLSRL